MIVKIGKQPKYPTTVKQMIVKFIQWTITESDTDLLIWKYVYVCAIILH